MEVKNISPYLASAPDVWVKAVNMPISKDLPQMFLGNMPKDGGHLILNQEEKDDLVSKYPESSGFIKQYIGAQEILKGIVRYCLAIRDCDLENAKQIPEIKERLLKVSTFRRNSSAASTSAFSDRPHKFAQSSGFTGDSKNTLVIPSVSSEKRNYLATMFCIDGEVVNNRAFMIPNAEMWHFAITASRLHILWLDAVGGKLEDRLSYSNTLVWNTFPLPELTDEQKQQLKRTGQKILNARHFHPDLTLGDMYNTENMGPELLAAHQENDRALEKIFRDKPFKDDDDRLAHLFERYSSMTKKSG